MKRNTWLFTLLLSSFILAGCSEEEQLYRDKESITTYLQVGIPRTVVESRTVGTPTLAGTPEENAIADITIYLTNSRRTIKMDNITLENTGPGSFSSELIPIRGDMLDEEFQVFVVTNAGKADLSLRSSADFKEMYSLQPDANKVVTLGQMVMSNQVEQSPVPTITVTRENTRDNPAKVHVLLDRLAAKIEPLVSVNFEADFGARPKENAFFSPYTFTVVGAGLLNAPTEFNLEQLWSEGNGEVIQLLSPSWFYKPEAAYFNRYYNTLDAYNTANPPFVSFNEEAANGYHLISSPFYCLENNSPFYDYTGSSISPENQIPTKYKGLATGVIFKVQATLGNEGVTFYFYEGLYYSDSEEDRLALAAVAGLQPEDFNDIALLREKQVRVYENGYIYYPYWIKNTKGDAEDNYDLSYTIIRNSYYKLRVQRLTEIGNDIPSGGYAPEEPIDKIEQIEIVAVAQDWTLVNVEHTFN